MTQLLLGAMTIAPPTPAQPLRIGTRGSPLALWQAHEVRRSLMVALDAPEAAFEIVVIKVLGDQVLDRSLKTSVARACSPARSKRRFWTAASTLPCIR